MKAIRIQNLKKSYDNIEAVKGISFDVDKDSFFAFLGPNGAGKSTTINIISTLLDYDQGEIEILGHKLGENDDEIRKKIGIVFQNSMLDDLLTVKENLQIRGSFYGINKELLEDRVAEINSLLDIKAFYNQRYKSLSGGQRRKADIARALLNWPEILILDEPTTGLDPKSRKDIWELINRLRIEKEITIFLTTHYMEEVVDANKVVIINEGEIIATGSSEELRLKYSNDRVKIIPKNGTFEQKLKEDNVEFYYTNDVVNIIVENCFEGMDVVEKYKDHIKEFEILRGNMDDVFVNITGRKLVNY